MLSQTKSPVRGLFFTPTCGAATGLVGLVANKKPRKGIVLDWVDILGPPPDVFESQTKSPVRGLFSCTGVMDFWACGVVVASAEYRPF